MKARVVLPLSTQILLLVTSRITWAWTRTFFASRLPCNINLKRENFHLHFSTSENRCSEDESPYSIVDQLKQIIVKYTFLKTESELFPRNKILYEWLTDFRQLNIHKPWLTIISNLTALSPVVLSREFVSEINPDVSAKIAYTIQPSTLVPLLLRARIHTLRDINDYASKALSESNSLEIFLSNDTLEVNGSTGDYFTAYIDKLMLGIALERLKNSLRQDRFLLEESFVNFIENNLFERNEFLRSLGFNVHTQIPQLSPQDSPTLQRFLPESGNLRLLLQAVINAGKDEKLLAELLMNFTDISLGSGPESFTLDIAKLVGSLYNSTLDIANSLCKTTAILILQTEKQGQLFKLTPKVGTKTQIYLPDTRTILFGADPSTVMIAEEDPYTDFGGDDIAVDGVDINIGDGDDESNGDQGFEVIELRRTSNPFLSPQVEIEVGGKNLTGSERANFLTTHKLDFSNGTFILKNKPPGAPESVGTSAGKSSSLTDPPLAMGSGGETGASLGGLGMEGPKGWKVEDGTQTKSDPAGAVGKPPVALLDPPSSRKTPKPPKNDGNNNGEVIEGGRLVDYGDIPHSDDLAVFASLGPDARFRVAGSKEEEGRRYLCIEGRSSLLGSGVLSLWIPYEKAIKFIIGDTLKDTTSPSNLPEDCKTGDPASEVSDSETGDNPFMGGSVMLM